MQTFSSLMRVAVLAAMMFLSYWGLAVLSFQDFVWQMTVAENAESRQQVFYILPWLMLAMSTLIPLVGMLVAMRRWYLEKLWRKSLAAVAVLVLLGLIALLTSQWVEQRDVSFRPWKPADSGQAEQAKPQAEPGTEVKPATSDALAEKPEGRPQESSEVRPTSAEEALETATSGPWYGKYLNKCTAHLDQYTAYFEKAREMDNEMKRVTAVLVERVGSGRMQKDWAIDVAERTDARIDVHNEVMVPRHRHYQEERDRIESIGNGPPGYLIPWLIKLENEIDADSASLEDESAKVEAITAELRQMLDN